MSSKTTSSTDWKGMLVKLEDQLSLYLVDKAPAIPKEWKDLIVKVAPWVMLVFAIIGIPAVLAVLGLGAAFMPFGYLGGIRYGTGITVSWILSVVILVLNFLAIPGLFNKTKQGWNFLFYATLLGAVDNLLVGNLVGLIIGTLLGLYILFQVREYYK